MLDCREFMSCPGNAIILGELVDPFQLLQENTGDGGVRQKRGDDRAHTKRITHIPRREYLAC